MAIANISGNILTDSGVATSSLLPLTGGTLTGALNGTSAVFSGFLGVNGSPGTAFPFEAYINSSTAYSSTSRGNVMRVYNSNTGANVFAGIELGGAGTANDGLAGLNAIVTGSGSAALTFYTRDGGTFAERVRVAANGNVGIGTSSPSQSLDVVGTIRFRRPADTTQYLDAYVTGGEAYFDANNSAAGTSQAIIFRNGNSGGITERMRITSEGNVLINKTSQSNVRFYVRSSTQSSSDYTIYADNSVGDLMYLRNDGQLSTGNRANSPYNLTIAASANCFIYSDGVLFRATSSARYKKDIEDLNIDTFGLINKIRPVWYRSTTGNDREDWSWYGFIAEELAEIDPRFVHFGYAPEDYIKDEETNETKLKNGAELRADGVMYDRLTVLLMKGMQEQQKKIEELSAKVSALENKS